MKTAFLFPGQGAQVVEMGKDIAQEYPVAEDIFTKANQIVGYDLKQLCFEGPQDKLNSTVYSQPAIFTVSAAILEVIKTQNIIKSSPEFVAGLSLGEYTALYAAGAISFENALTLVQKRGQAMQEAADNSKGAMVSILGLDEQKVHQLCDEAAKGELLVPANFNCPGQIVISGSVVACNRAVELAEKFGAMKAIPLAVAGAFHSSMMMPAADALAAAIAKTDLIYPESIKVLANIKADFYTDKQDIAEGLKKQLTESILWQKSMEKLIDLGCETFYEIGPGRVLTGLMKKINRRANIVNISSLESLKKVIE